MQCAIVTASECTSVSGTYQGDGVTCDDANCPNLECPEDLDGSGAVDFGDILLVLGHWGETDRPEDLDDSGLVDFGDLLIVLNAWGPCK